MPIIVFNKPHPTLLLSKEGIVNKRRIFVFGSNLAGRHGKGAALYAKENHGAVYGKGQGLQGTSYAVPTKDEDLNVLLLPEIQFYVSQLLEFAQQHPELEFLITPLACGYAGYQYHEVAPFFIGAPDNCILPQEFVDALAERWRTK